MKVVTKGPCIPFRLRLGTDLARLIWPTKPLVRIRLFETTARDLDGPSDPDARRSVVVASPFSCPKTSP